MPPETAHGTGGAPLLFRHATPRTSTGELPGRYDPTSLVWVVDTTAGALPVVAAADLAELETSTSTRVRQEGDDDDATSDLTLAGRVATSTHTAVKQEADDEDISGDARLFVSALETSTLTKVRQEGADDDFACDETMRAFRCLHALAELATKTDVQQESDDESATLEMETRSLNNQEGLDEDFPPMLLELQTKTFAQVEGDDDSSLLH